MLVLGLMLLGFGLVCLLARSDKGCGSDHIDVTHNDGSTEVVDWRAEARRDQGRLSALGDVMIEKLEEERRAKR